MANSIRTLLGIFFISVIPTIIIWLPFFFRVEKVWGIPLESQGMATVVANYDGPLFLVAAKTLYDKALISQNFSFGLPTEYYAAHFPLFPVLIRLGAPLFGFPYSMLFVTVLSSILASYFFFLFINLYVKREYALFLTFFFSIFPARWLIVRSVGSAEPLFIACLIASVYFFKKEKYIWAGIWGALAQLTKSPGILLFLAYSFAILIPYFKNMATSSLTRTRTEIAKITNIFPLLLIPGALLVVFVFYKMTMNDFFAYFHSGDNIHLFFPPFQIFNYSAPWVGTFWLEEVIFVYLLSLLGLMKLIQLRENVTAWFVGIFLISIFFVSHRDIVRYSLPLVPFIIAAFSKTLAKKEYIYVILLLLIPIYLFSITYISQNVMPISDWAPLL